MPEAAPVVLHCERFALAIGPREIALSGPMFDVVEMLCRRPGRVRSRYELAEACGLSPDSVSDRVIDWRIKRLRRKLGPDADLVVTRRDLGYAWTTARPVMVVARTEG